MIAFATRPSPRAWFLLLLLWLSSPKDCLSQQNKPLERSAAELMDVVMWNREPIGGRFSLTDHTGRKRTEADFRGKLMLVYFGYTFCPDICPTDLQQIGLALKGLGSDAKRVAPLFITLDPERDTQELLSHYVPAFHPQLVGLTGNLNSIQQVASAYKVFHQKVSISGWSRYTIDHSSFIYLMDETGQYQGFLPPGTSADRIVTTVKTLLSKTRHIKN